MRGAGGGGGGAGEMCPAHEAPLNYWCKTCGEALCSDCAMFGKQVRPLLFGCAIFRDCSPACMGMRQCLCFVIALSLFLLPVCCLLPDMPARSTRTTRSSG